MIYGPAVRWDGAVPPSPDYLEDAHAREFDRPYPQLNVKRFADSTRAYLARLES